MHLRTNQRKPLFYSRLYQSNSLESPLDWGWAAVVRLERKPIFEKNSPLLRLDIDATADLPI